LFSCSQDNHFNPPIIEAAKRWIIDTIHRDAKGKDAYHKNDDVATSWHRVMLSHVAKTMPWPQGCIELKKK
jgi:hypothetical protein